MIRTFRAQAQHVSMWPTHDDLTLIASAYPVDGFLQCDDETLDAEVATTLEQFTPVRAAAMRTGERVGGWKMGSVGNFVRRAQGPGWALVGDAAYTRDPITGSGVTDSLCMAELLVDALAAAGPNCSQAQALADYEQHRDDALLGHFAYTCDFAAVRPHTREEKEIIAAMCRSPWHASGMVGVFSGVIHPSQFYTRRSFEELFEYMGPRRKIGPKLAFVDLLMRRLPGRPRWAKHLAFQLLAANLGAMGPYLLTPQQDKTARPAVAVPAGDPALARV